MFFYFFVEQAWNELASNSPLAVLSRDRPRTFQSDTRDKHRMANLSDLDASASDEGGDGDEGAGDGDWYKVSTSTR